MPIVCGFDTETTGLSDCAKVAEVGLVLYDMENERPITQNGFLVKTGDAIWEPGAAEANGLSAEKCNTAGISEEEALDAISMFFEQCEFVVTHNGIFFDRRVLTNWLTRKNFAVPERPWIDTFLHLPKHQKLGIAAYEHGITNSCPHGALGDAMTCVLLLDKYDFNETLAFVNGPKVTLVVGDTEEYRQTDFLKAMGFRAIYVDGHFKDWRKPILTADLKEEVEKVMPLKPLGFKAVHDNGESGLYGIASKGGK